MTVGQAETIDVAGSQSGRDEPPGAGEQPAAARSRRPLVAGGLAGLWALVVGVGLVTCLVMVAWALSPNSAGDSAAAWRAAGLTWLGAHLVPLQVGGEPLTLLPIGGLLLGLLLARRAGGWAGRMLPEPAVPEVAMLVLGFGLLYGAGGAVVAWLSAASSASAHPAQAALVTGAVAAVGALWGISRQVDGIARVRARASEAAWRTWLAGLAAVAGLFAAGAALATVSLVRHLADVAGTLADLRAGPIGAAGVTLLDALSLPNLAIWASSVLAGPGFELGSTGQLSAFDGQVRSLPALPVLAAIPTTLPAWTPALMLVPVALGVLAGRIRWGRDLPTLSGTLLGALGLAAVVVPLTAGMLRLSMGALGADRLAHVGPDLLPVTAAATGLVLLGFLAEAAYQSLRLSWELHRAERRVIDLRAASGTSAVAPAEDPASGDAGLDAPAADSPVAGAVGRSVGQRVVGAGASAISVVHGVGGAARAAVAGVGSAIAGQRGTGAGDGAVDPGADLLPAGDRQPDAALDEDGQLGARDEDGQDGAAAAVAGPDADPIADPSAFEPPGDVPGDAEGEVPGDAEVALADPPCDVPGDAEGEVPGDAEVALADPPCDEGSALSRQAGPGVPVGADDDTADIPIIMVAGEPGDR